MAATTRAPAPPVGFSDYYLVVPLPEAWSSQQPVLVIGANDSDDAAQAAFDMGYGRCGTVVVEVHERGA